MSCNKELAVAWKVIMAAPSGMSTNSTVRIVGASAAPTNDAPNARPAGPSSLWLARARLADASATTMAPGPMKDIRSPNVREDKTRHQWHQHRRGYSQLLSRTLSVCAPDNSKAKPSGEYSFSQLARYLLVMDDLDESPELIACAGDLAASDPAAEFVLLVPATMLAPFDALLLPYATQIQLARERAQRMRSEILDAGLRLVVTRLGNSSPLRALEDALRFADYAAVVIASPPHPLMHKMHRDLPCRAASRFPDTRVIHAGGGKSRLSPLATIRSGSIANGS